MSGSGERERGEDSEVRGKEEAVVDAERGRALRFVPQSVSAPVTFPPPAVWNITTVSLWPPAMSSLSRSRLPRLQLPLTTWRAPPSVFPLMGFERAACLNHLVSLYDPSNLITVYKKKKKSADYSLCAYQEILGYFRYPAWGCQQSGYMFRFRRHRLTSPDITDPEPVESALFRWVFFCVCAWGWTQVSRVIMLPLKMSCVRHGFKIWCKGVKWTMGGGIVWTDYLSVWADLLFFLSWSSVEYHSGISPW